MNTITLNEALKQRVYDSVAISEITASSLNADTVATVPRFNYMASYCRQCWCN